MPDSKNEDALSTAETGVSLPDSVVSVLHALISAHRIDQIIVFGSRAIGDYDDRSDVDIAINAPNLPEDALAMLKDEVENGPSLYWISIIHFQSMPGSLQQRVIETGVTFYEREKSIG